MFRGTEESTEMYPLVFVLEAVLRPRVAKMIGKWYWGSQGSAHCFMARWHGDKAEGSCLSHSAEDHKRGDTGRGWGWLQLSTNL